MGQILQEVDLTWRGESHRIRPTMEAIERIEGVICLSTLAQRFGRSEIPLSHVGLIVYECGRLCGLPATKEEIYGALNGAAGEQAQSELMQAATALILALFPSHAPVATAAKKKTGKPKRRKK